MNLDSPIPQETELECQQMLREHLLQNGADEDYVQSQIDFIFPLVGGFVERFEYIDPFLSSEDRKNLLISGAAVGSELIQAKKFGFKNVTGTEVLEVYVDICQKRLANVSNTEVDLYNGQDLAYKDNSFTCIMSGHIIEHTDSPFIYLKEHMRVLTDDGIFFLEFPDRNHDIELHTGTKSFEKYPLPIRNLFLRIYSSPLQRDDQKRFLYGNVLKSLNPISVKDILNWIKKAGNNVKVVDTQHPHPGFTRVILRKQ